MAGLPLSDGAEIANELGAALGRHTALAGQDGDGDRARLRSDGRGRGGERKGFHASTPLLRAAQRRAISARISGAGVNHSPDCLNAMKFWWYQRSTAGVMIY